MAGRQHGVLARAQIFSLGITAREIDRQLALGSLQRLHRGVYLLGPVLTMCARELAVVLACSPRAALSHPSAAQLWRALPYPAEPEPAR